MKKIISSLCCFTLCTLLLNACSDSKDNQGGEFINSNRIINPVTDLIAEATENENEIAISWKSTEDSDIENIEISYNIKGHMPRYTPSATILPTTSGQEHLETIVVPSYAQYTVAVTAISKYGKRSASIKTEVIPARPANYWIPEFLERADTYRANFVNKFLGGSYDAWNNSYPNTTTGHYGGIAVVWGQGGAFSGCVATYRASQDYPYYKDRSDRLEDRLYTSLNKFINDDNGNGSKAFGTLLGPGDERFYDDNAWVALDMIDMYIYTGNTRYLNMAKMVWNFLMEGYDDVTGGGIYWNERSNSKHTCSTAPVAVLGAKLYQQTNNEEYLNIAKDLYQYCIDVLQDHTDHLFWDNARLDENGNLSIATAKYSYNSGQPLQAAALLYKITGEQAYLDEALLIAEACYQKWFFDFNSVMLDQSFRMIEKSSGNDTWFHAIMCRGFFELYDITQDRTYVSSIEKTLNHAWLSGALNAETKLMSGDFSGATTNITRWPVIEQGAILELYARMAIIQDMEHE